MQRTADLDLGGRVAVVTGAARGRARGLDVRAEPSVAPLRRDVLDGGLTARLRLEVGP